MVDKDKFEESVTLWLGLGINHLLRRGIVKPGRCSLCLGTKVTSVISLWSMVDSDNDLNT